MATLNVDAVSDLSAAKADVDSLGAAVRGLGSDVDAAGSVARTASLDLDGMGEGADNVASKSSQAAGAMGDLAGGLDAIGATGAATALEGVALGSQVAAGAGDALNLVAETQVGRWVANTTAMAAHKVASAASTAATITMTGATAALNAVLAINPVVLIVAALALLAVGLVLAYKHSETFRNIVDGAFTRARDVVEGAADKVQDFIGFMQSLPGEAREAWEAVRSAIADKITAAGDKVEGLIDDAKRLPRDAVTEISGYFSDFFEPIQTAIGWVQDLIDKIKSIDFPDFPDLPFTRSASTTGVRPEDGGGGSSPWPTSVGVDLRVDLNNGIVSDPVGLGDALADALVRRAAALGVPLLPA